MLITKSLRSFLGRTVALSLFLCMCTGLWAQDNVFVYGSMKDYMTSRKIPNGSVVVYKNGSKVTEIPANASGKFEANLDYGAEYKLQWVADGFVQKNILIDTRSVSEEDRAGGHGMNIDITLLTELPGVDFDLLKQPFGKAKYQAEEANFMWDMEYTETMRSAQAKLLKDYENQLKNADKLEENYKKAIEQGDAAMAQKNYKKAVDSYNDALSAKPKDAIATAKLSDAEIGLKSENAAAELEKEYQALIKDADDLFKKGEFDNAKGKYEAALKVKEEEAYPKAQLKACDAKIKEAAALAEKERLAAEKQAKYDAAVAAGQEALKKEELDVAEAKFKEAQSLMPQETLPPAKLQEISDKRASLAAKEEEERKAKELQEKYDAAIAAGDAAFSGEQYDNAKAKYNEALGVKPDEKYPKGQLEAIEAKLQELKEKEEADRLAKEIDDKYNAAISAADASFTGGEFDAAKTKYNEALGVKPDESYPKDQLAAIEKKLQELKDQEEADRLAKELNEKYEAAIAAADGAFGSADFDEAKSKYEEALGLKADETYPKDQLAAIERKLDELAKAEEEQARLAALEEEYQAAIAEADASFSADDFETAAKHYEAASKLKSDEQYPKDQLNVIQTKLDELAQQKKEAERLEKQQADYDAAIADADKALNKQNWEEAKAKYQEAKSIKPDETYPDTKLAEIQAELDRIAAEEAERKKQEELEASYNAKIESADKSYHAENWQSALNDYKDALNIKPGEAHPTERISEIESKMDAAAQAQAEADRLKQLEEEKEARYKDLVASGDQAFAQNNWADAKIAYTSASEVKPEEQYPLDQLAAIDAKLAADAEAADAAEAARLAAEKAAAEKAAADAEAARLAAEKAEADRLAALAAADAEAEAARLAAEKAEADRLAALAEEERLAAEKAEADRLAALAEAERLAAEKAEAERLAAAAGEIEQQYQNKIAEADLAFNSEDYSNAKTAYQEALRIKEDAYPKGKIEEIESILASRAAAEAEEARLKEQARLDEEARLRAEREAADAARAAEEAERLRRESAKEKAAEYERIVLDADKSFAESEYPAARALYAQAMDIKPDEAYPKSQLERIDQILAEIARKDREAEEARLAAERAEQERLERQAQARVNSGESDAERFMREAREREEAEKYERIKRLKANVKDSTNLWANGAQSRQDGAISRNESIEETQVGLYKGSEEGRLANMEEIERLKRARKTRTEELAAADAEMSGALMAQKNALEGELANRSSEWNAKQTAAFNASSAEEKRAAYLRQLEQANKERTSNSEDAVASAKNTTEKNARDRSSAARERAGAARAEIDSKSDHLKSIDKAGDSRTAEAADKLALTKEKNLTAEQMRSNAAKNNREAQREKLANTPLNEQRSSKDYGQGDLAKKYPQGVTEESYSEGNKVIIRRVVVIDNKADEYNKVIAKWGTFYFKNGQSISKTIWTNETNGEGL